VLKELKQGRTPSPDILCNEWIKFGLFFDKIDPNFQKIVSGHYAQVEQRAEKFLLKRSPDAVKDQTYFLSRLDQQQLSRLWFPIGHLTKKQVRGMAQKLDLPNRDRKDSQGICFLGKIKYPEFVRYHLGERKGEIIDIESSKVLGEHKGVWFHTVGQRKGLRLPGGPWYVVKKDLPANKLFVAHADRYLEHARADFTVADVRWISGEPGEGRARRAAEPPREMVNSSAGTPRPTYDLQTKVRHSPHLENCRIEPAGDGRWTVHLENKDQGIAAGQSAIFYDGDICLGGGVIE